jgi:cyclic pyranopterin phosphate synthase
MPPEGVPARRHADLLSFEDIARAARAAADLGITKIRLTGGEPLVRRGLADLVRMLAAVPGIATLAITTNATLFAPVAADLKAAGLTHINISLDTLDPARYSEVTRGGKLEGALRGIEAARALGLPLKINMVVFPETPAEEIERVRAYCDTMGASLQRIALYSLGSGKADGHACERPQPCASCNRIRLTADGMLRPCLRSELELPFDPRDPAASIRRAIERKPKEGGVCFDRAISEIGG